MEILSSNLSLGDALFKCNNKELCSDTDPLSLYAQKLQGKLILRDRFGELNNFSNWNLGKEKDIIPSGYNPKSFRDICFNTAKSIYDRAIKENKDIYISWSGGVDSSCLLSTFLMLGEDNSRIHVLCSNESISEYPLLYFKLKSENIDIILIKDTSKMLDVYGPIVKNNLIVFGWCGDQLYGSDVNNKYPEWFHKNWRDFIRYMDMGNTVDRFDHAFKAYGLPIDNCAQFFWWLNFSCKWTHVSKVFSLVCGNTENIVNFYEDIDFQNWSIARFDRVDYQPPTSTEYYKPEMKEIIYDYTHDEHYKKNKGKVGSFCVYANSYKNILGVENSSGILLFDGKDYSSITNELLKYRKNHE